MKKQLRLSSMDRLVASVCVGAGIVASTAMGQHTVGPGVGYDFDNIQDAVNFASPGESVIVSGGTYTASKGEAVVVVPNKEIVIYSVAGAASTIIDGEDARRGVILVAPSNSSSGATLRGFTIKDGLVSGEGGGVLMGGKSWVEDCVIMNCEANIGGGIAAMVDFPYPEFDPGSTLSGGIKNLQITGNTSDSHGGGVALIGSGEAPNLDFIATCAIHITENQAGGRGGGIYLHTATLTLLKDLKCIYSDILHIDQNTSVQHGAGLHARLSRLFFDDDHPEPTINFIIEDNHTQGNGGGMAFFDCYPVVLREGIIQQNTALNAGGYGGGIWARDTGYAMFDMAIVTNSAAEAGGGIRNRNTAMEIEGVSIESNCAENSHGGGISEHECITTKITDCKIASNAGVEFGGGISSDNCGTLELDGCNFEQNTLSPNRIDLSYGGGVYVRNTRLTSLDSRWEENTAGYGGGLFIGCYASIIGSDPMTIESGTFRKNASELVGGGVYVNGDVPLLVTDSVFRKNTTNGQGQALSAYGADLEVTLQDSIVRLHTSSFGYTAVYANDSSMSILGCDFYSNETGVSTGPDSTIDIVDSKFCGHEFGVRSTFSSSVVSIRQSRFAENVVDIYGPWDDLGMNLFLAQCPLSAEPNFDLNGDGVVDGADIGLLLAMWGHTIRLLTSTKMDLLMAATSANFLLRGEFTQFSYVVRVSPHRLGRDAVVLCVTQFPTATLL